MYLNFNPSDIQATGIGLAAFLATVLLVFVFLGGRRERLGMPLAYVLCAAVVWSWFGFLYHIVPGLVLAREMRIISVAGIVGMVVLQMHFALVYLGERIEIGPSAQVIRRIVELTGALFFGALIADFFGTGYVVGPLLASPSIVLAPQAGPLMILLVIYYMTATAISGIFLAIRARVGIDESDRRQALWLFFSMTVGFALGGTRFTPWYGFDFYPLFGDIGFPLFAFSALYTMHKYKLLNREIAAAQILIFTIWTLSFFSLLLDRTAATAAPDAIVFIAAIVLGVFLIRSVVKEAASQRSLARLTLEKGKSEFATIAAHQLRTPITAVRWSFEGLKATSLTDEQRAFVQKGSQAADAMRELANDLLDVDRIEMGVFGYAKEPGDLRDALKLASMIASDHAQERGVMLSVEMPETPLHATYDRGKLALVLENLLDNAIKYSPHGGTVTVQAGIEAGEAIVRVHDSGIGLTSEEAAHLFEKFFRSDEARKAFPDGSGLGLFIVKTIIEGHGGTIEASSDGRGKGTTMTVRLPVQ